MSVEITGLEEFEFLLRRVGNVSPRILTAVTKRAANFVRAKARGDAPNKKGKLRQGIKLKAEKRKTGKKVYQIWFDPKMNNVFVKETRAGKRYYYPASQEYGFRKNNGGYVPGRYFMKNAVNSLRTETKQSIIDDLIAHLNRIVNGGG